MSVGSPKPAFAQKVSALLEQHGYTVDYYPGEEVTVDFYRNLPTRGYDLILLRAHSGLTRGGSRDGEAFLFTAERYSNTKYADDLSARRLLMATYSIDGLSAELRNIPRFFGIVPDFIEASMVGSFEDTAVILMGCNGLSGETMAEALVSRGAKTFISWDGPVTGDHTDAATDRLLQLLLKDRLTAEDAVAQTMAEIGPDPWYESKLLSYPPGR